MNQSTKTNQQSIKFVDKVDKKKEDLCATLFKIIPQILFFMILASVLVICLLDFKLVIKLFNLFIEWIKVHPYQGISYSIALLAVSITFSMPISYTIIMLGYTYS